MPFLRWRRATTGSTALVVFHCSASDAQAIDVAVGPCVPRVGPRGGRLRPIASPLSQTRYTLDRLESLYAVLTGRDPKEAFEERRNLGPGTMVRLSDTFAASLASLGTVTIDVDSTLADQRAAAERWFKATKWPPTMQLGGLASLILDWSLVSRTAKEKGHSTYGWVGPSVPMYGVVHGVGNEAYEEYRRRKGMKPTRIQRAKGESEPPEPPEGR